MDALNRQIVLMYLGKYKDQFFSLNALNRYVYISKCNSPMLALEYDPNLKQVILYEYIKIESDDVWSGTFVHYCHEIEWVSIEDPSGTNKMEKAITNSFLTGTQN